MSQDDKRQRILAAATAVFAERDFHEVRVEEVASRAGVGKGTLYLYFPTKDDLQQMALRASLERVAEEVDEAAAADAPLDVVLERMVVSILRFFWRRPHLLTIVQRFEQRSPARSREKRHRVLTAITSVLTRHRLGGNGSGRRLSAAFLLGLARAAILEHASTDRPEAAAARVVQCYLYGIGGRTAGARRQRGAA